MILCILSYASGPSVCPPWRSVCSGTLPIFYWIVCLPGIESYEFIIYFGDQIFVRGIICNIFSHTFGFLFIFLMFSLAVQKLFNLMKSHLFILSFISLVLEDVLVKILLHGISYCLCFFVGSFIFSDFIYLFLERGEGREKRGRETSAYVCLSCAPNWEPGPQPRHMP